MNTIEQYVLEKIRAGADLDALRKTLITVGWKEDSVDAALARALVAQGVPSPEGVAQRGDRRAAAVEVVINVFSFILLGIVATALGILYFGIIDKFFPDPLAVQYSYSSNTASVHYAIAAILVAFPLYVFAVRLWFRRFREDREKEESKISKWLTYLVLLIAAVTIVGDLIAVLFNFLQGETSVRFFLKALTVLGIAGTVFGFYFLERKKIQYKKDIPRQTFLGFGYAIGALALVGIVLGFFAAGTPTKERMRQMDQQRANDLRNLATCVTQYAIDRGALPATLAALEESSMYAWCATNRFDPETKTEYGYAVVSPLVDDPSQNGAKRGSFELCADFSAASASETAAVRPSKTMYTGDLYDKWGTHPAGRACDTETVVVKEPLMVVPGMR
jgi:uncharacterized membrane protein YidH (DUF202 family)